jgi:CRISPR-associated DxTHG motif protein
MAVPVPAGSRERVLLATVGTAQYQPVVYAVEGRSHRTRFAPVASAVIEGGCGRAVLFVTEEAARTNLPALEGELAEVGIRCETHTIPPGRSETEVWTIFEQVLEVLGRSDPVEVVLDVTHAFRHLPVILFGSLAYLTATDQVTIARIRYGAYEARVGETVPLLDLTPLLTLLDAHHAVRQFVETGDARRLGRLLSDLNRQLWVGRVGDPLFSRVVSRLEHLSGSVSAGLPIEAGFHARSAADALEVWRSERRRRAAGIGDTLIERLRKLVEDFAVQWRGDKGTLPLSLEEVTRQLRIIRFYHHVGAHDRVLLLLREWIVNRCLLGLGVADWLDRSRRAAVERALNGLAERLATERRPNGPAARRPSIRELGALWASVRDLRNKVAHPGMCPDEVRPSASEVGSHLRTCEDHCEDDGWWVVHPKASMASVLVTPLGLSPGVLYTAFAQLAPSLTLVITSEEARPVVDDVARRAAYDAARVRVYTVRDPHQCFRERSELEAWVRPVLLDTSRVVLNITGGTTALQYLVETVGRRAERLGLEVERVAMVDRRSPEEQRRQPYVAGEVVRLDREDHDIDQQERSLPET